MYVLYLLSLAISSFLLVWQDFYLIFYLMAYAVLTPFNLYEYVTWQVLSIFEWYSINFNLFYNMLSFYVKK